MSDLAIITNALSTTMADRELELEREFIDDLRPGKLKEYIECTVLPTLRANPGTSLELKS